MQEYGLKLDFGKHTGKTIEQLHFIDYGYLVWLYNKTDRTQIKDYLERVPKIFPSKIQRECHGRLIGQCTDRTATRIGVLCDRKGSPIVEPGAAHYWCDECSLYSTGYRKGLAEFSLDFKSVLNMRRSGNRAGFYRILRIAYGIDRLSARNAYELFWG